MSSLSRRSLLLTILPAALLVAYSLPWIAALTSGLSLSGYDFAAWLNLHPASGVTQPILLGTFLLRLQLVLITWLFAVSVGRFYSVRWRQIAIGVILVLSVAQLPAIEFLRNSSDVNQRQQLILALFALSGGIIGVSGRLARFQQSMTLLLTFTALITSAWGVSQGLRLIQDYRPTANLGIGIIAYVAICMGTIIWTMYQKLQSHPEAAPQGIHQTIK